MKFEGLEYDDKGEPIDRGLPILGVSTASLREDPLWKTVTVELRDGDSLYVDVRLAWDLIIPNDVLGDSLQERPNVIIDLMYERVFSELDLEIRAIILEKMRELTKIPA